MLFLSEQWFTLMMLSTHISFLPERGRLHHFYYEILKGSGLPKANGKSKGGIKVHTLLHAGRDLPEMIRYSPAVNNDITYLKEVQLKRGSVVVFDKGYCDYRSYNRFIKQGVTWVTRHNDRSVYRIKEQYPVNDYQRKQGIKSDWSIELGYTYLKKTVQVGTCTFNQIYRSGE